MVATLASASIEVNSQRLTSTPTSHPLPETTSTVSKRGTKAKGTSQVWELASQGQERPSKVTSQGW